MTLDKRQVNRIFSRVHLATSQTILQLAKPLLEGMRHLGYGQRNSGHVIHDKVLEAVKGLVFRPMDEPPFASMTIRGAQEKRRAAVYEFFRGIGINEDTAGNYANAIIEVRANYRDAGKRKSLRTHNVPSNRPWGTVMRHWVPKLLHRGNATYARLQEIEKDATAPYAGSDSRPDKGVKQTVDLLRRFPAVANYIYQRCALPGLQGFPPKPTGSHQTDTHVFATAVAEHLDGEWWSEILFGAGLAVIAIVVTVASFGTLGPAAAAALGAGLGTAQGGLLVYRRAGDVAEARIAVQMGAMDEQTLTQLENSLEGAWGLLAVDVVTGGVLGKFGGTTILSSMLRGTAISAAGGGVGTAIDPNVWAAENRVALILKGTLIAGVAGAIGSGVGAGLSTVARGGSRVQVAMDRDGGPLAQGREVSVSFSRDTEPVAATVEAVTSGGVKLKVQGQSVDVRVDRAVAITADDAGAAATRRLPAAPDRAPRQMGYLLDAQTGQMRGTVRSRSTNDDLIAAPAHSQPSDGLSGYPMLQQAVDGLGQRGGTPYRLVELDGTAAVQVLRPANDGAHPGDLIRHAGNDYYASHVLRPEAGGSGVEVMPVSTRLRPAGVRGTDYTPTTPATSDTHQLLRLVQSPAGRLQPLLARRVVHHREMGSLSGFAEHAVQERLVPNNLVSGANPMYQRAVLSQYNDGATFIFVSHWESGRFFSWPSGIGTQRLDGSAHIRSTVGSSRAHMSAAKDMGTLTGIGGRAPVTDTAPAGSGQAVYNEFVGGTFQFFGGKLYWNDKSNSINEVISRVGRNDGYFFDDMHPQMTTRLQAWFGLREDQIVYLGSSRNFPHNSRE